MQSRSLFGLPSTLVLGYLGVGLFMTGDGIEQAFLSRYVVDIGFSAEHASLLFVVYGLAVAIASWLSGVLSEVWHPKRLMFAGVILWLLFHAVFLTYGLAEKDFLVMLAAYGIRGLSYPMFIYGFVVWITMVVPPERMASAMGWFWTMFALGDRPRIPDFPSAGHPRYTFHSRQCPRRHENSRSYNTAPNLFNQPAQPIPPRHTLCLICTKYLLAWTSTYVPLPAPRRLPSPPHHASCHQLQHDRQRVA